MRLPIGFYNRRGVSRRFCTGQAQKAGFLWKAGEKLCTETAYCLNGGGGMLTIFQINTELTRFIEMTPKNHVDQLTVFDAPLVAVAAADDPLFARMQQADAVGSGHWLPTDWLPGARAVVSYFLPFSAAVRQANRAAGMPAREWMIGRYEGEQCNAALRAHMVAWFNAHGVPAVAPSSDARLTVVERRSNWSERHVAYIAGLGTFSLSRSLITKQGSAGRLGSFVLALPLAATARDYATREEYCSHCGACIYRCPPLAITEQGKDNLVCAGYLDRVLARFQPRYGCGKCQTGVPCEAQIPVKCED